MSKSLKRTLVLDSPVEIDQEIKVSGFVASRRDHGKLIFIDLRDRTGLVQVVFNPRVSEKAHELASSLRPESAVSITGLVKKRPEHLVNDKIVSGTIEIEAVDLEILSMAEALPFDMGGEVLNLELPTLLDNRSLTIRHDSVKAIFELQEAILEGFKRVSRELECTEIVVPTIAASSTEGGAEVFKVDYYGHKAFMTQSPQLYKQMMIPVFERVFTIAHAYRAEPSVTTRHLAETTQIDFEFGFVDFGELLDLFEKVMIETFKYVESEKKTLLDEIKAVPLSLGKIPRLTLREAQEIIYKEYGRDNRSEKDLAPQDEIDICEWALKNHKSDLVTITHFPTKKRAFYTMPDKENPEFSLSYDLLFRGVEIMSGSLRISDYFELVKAIEKRDMDIKDFGMYLQAFKFGMPPEGGFSFGLERITMKLLGLQNIREASLFPRDMERVDERFSTKNNENKKTKKKIIQKKSN